MAEKILDTRIQLKYDTYSNWYNNNPTLKSGEIAIVEVPVNANAENKAENGKVVEQQPAILFKVGDGSKAFRELGWTSANAANVYDWAKAPTRPEYSAEDITGIDAYIAAYVNEQMGISVDTDTQYAIVPVEGDAYKYEFKSKGKTDTAYSTVATITIPKYDDTALSGKVSALENLVGNTAVATQIANALAKLETDGVYVKRQDFEELERTSDDHEERIVDLEEAIETKQETIAWQSDNYDKNTNKAITKSDLDAAVENLVGVMHFEGTYDELPATGEAGDVVLVGNKEYVYGKDGKWHELGDESLYAVKGNIKNADIADDAAIAQSKIAGLSDSLNEAKNGAIEGANSYTDEKIDDLDKNVNDYLSGQDEQINELEQIILNPEGVDETENGNVTLNKLLSDNLSEANKHADDAVTTLDNSLAAIAKTGNVNDLVQTEGDILVFYCGTSSEVI